MESRSVAGIFESNGALNRTVGALVAGVVLAGSLLTIYTMINAQNFWATIDQQNAAEIDQENRAFCGRFDIEPGTEAYDPCADELDRIRQVHAERLRRYRF